MSRVDVPHTAADDVQKELVSRKCDIPVRYLVALLTFLGFFSAYTSRVNLSVAIVAMGNNAKFSTLNSTQNIKVCPELVTEAGNKAILIDHVGLKKKESFAWDIETQSIILGAFYYGYVATQLPGSLLIQRFGAKWFYGLSVLISSILTLLTPVVADWGSTPVILLRTLQGFAQGPMFPSMNVLISNWVPVMERSRTYTFVTNGMPIGITVGMLVSGVLTDSNFLGGWPSVFYVFGGFGCLWFVFWTILIYETPSVHPRISESELKFIQEHQKKPDKKCPDIPWRSILTSLPVLSLIIATIGQYWGTYMLMSEMPSYLYNILHIDIKMSGLYSAIPYVLQATVGMVGSYIADRLRKNGKLTINTIRKLMNSIAFFTTGLCILLLAFVGCRPFVSVMLLCTAMTLNGLAYSGAMVTAIDMTPTYTGAVTGMATTIGNLAGFLSPYTVGEITSKGQTVSNWGVVFIITGVMYFFTGLFFDIFGSAELQPWDSDAPQQKPKNNLSTYENDVSTNKNSITKF